MAYLQQRPPFEAEYGVLSLEIRPWALVATRREVSIGIGNCFTGASSMVWYDFIIAVNNVPLHYIRFPYQCFGHSESRVKSLLSGENSKVAWYSDCPSGKLELSVDDYADGPPPRYRLSVYLAQANEYAQIYQLDTSFEIDELVADDLLEFARQMDAELEAVAQGHSPDPDSVPAAFATLPLAREMNTRAYDAIGTGYQFDYFASPFYQPAFDNWFQHLPPSAAVLDVGCGHGEPVIRQLLVRGYQVTGLDLSPKMLALAKEHFPEAAFQQGTATDLNLMAAFDGACACFSLTLMDPIELRVSLKRLHQALKPGGQLLLIGGSPDINSRSSPLSWWKGQPVWEWNYEPSEIRAAVVNSGLFTEVAFTEDALETPPAASVAPVEPAAGIPAPPDWMTGGLEKRFYTLIAQRID